MASKSVYDTLEVKAKAAAAAYWGEFETNKLDPEWSATAYSEYLNQQERNLCGDWKVFHEKLQAELNTYEN